MGLPEWLWEIFFKPMPEKAEGPRTIKHNEYINSLSYHFDPNSLSDEEKIARAKRAFEMVLDTRKFEIEMYWKRAAYFWAFIVSTFGAYIAVQKNSSPSVVLSIIVLGVIISTAWHLSNLGSKQWQRHWEKHLDLLEDRFVGPLYKTVHFDLTWSVSKLNNIVSFFVMTTWFILGIDHIFSSYKASFSISTEADWKPVFIIAVGVLGLIPMFSGYGRGRFKMAESQMYRRRIKYDKVELPTPTTAAADSAAGKSPAA